MGDVLSIECLDASAKPTRTGHRRDALLRLLTERRLGKADQRVICHPQFRWRGSPAGPQTHNTPTPWLAAGRRHMPAARRRGRMLGVQPGFRAIQHAMLRLGGCQLRRYRKVRHPSCGNRSRRIHQPQPRVVRDCSLWNVRLIAQTMAARVVNTFRCRLPRRHVDEIGCGTMEILADAHGQPKAGRILRRAQAGQL